MGDLFTCTITQEQQIAFYFNITSVFSLVTSPLSGSYPNLHSIRGAISIGCCCCICKNSPPTRLGKKWVLDSGRQARTWQSTLLERDLETLFLLAFLQLLLALTVFAHTFAWHHINNNYLPLRHCPPFPFCSTLKKRVVKQGRARTTNQCHTLLTWLTASEIGLSPHVSLMHFRQVYLEKKYFSRQPR